MKRAVLAMVCLAIALPVLAGRSGAVKRPLTMQHCVSLQHTASGWRMEIVCREGKGVIVLTDVPGIRRYRGSGVFAGWSQEQLDATYQSLIPADASGIELIQLG